MLPPADEAILGACFHGHAEELDQLGLKPEWLEHPATREIVQAIFALSRAGKPVNILNIMVLSKNVPRELWPSVKEISMNGYGDVMAGGALEAAKRAYVVRQATPLARELETLLRDKPGSSGEYLPRIASQLVQLIRTGEAYDARPSAHWQKSLPQITFKTKIPQLNDVLRGGYRNGMLVIFAGLTKNGKTTMLVTMAVDALMQGKKVCVINTENSEQKFLARIFQGLGFTVDEIIAKKASTPDRQSILESWLESLESKLRIYNWEWLNDERIKRIVKWENPDLLLIDYLMDLPGMFAKQPAVSKQDNVGLFADFLLRVANSDCGIPIVTAGQVSDDAAKRFKRFDVTDAVILYGTARVGYAADIYAGLKRHNTKRNTAYVYVWYDRIGNRLDTPHEIPFDERKWIFCANSDSTPVPLV